MKEKKHKKEKVDDEDQGIYIVYLFNVIVLHFDTFYCDNNNSDI